MSTEERRLLIVEVHARGAGNYPRFDILRRHGYAIFYLTSSEAVDPYSFADIRRVPSKFLDDLRKAAEEWHREVGFDAVMTTDEASVIATASIAEALQLPGLGLKAAQNSRNKWFMRLAHQAGGAPHPQFARCDTLEDALVAAKEIGYPVILKPTLGALAQHVYKISGSAEMENRFAAAMEGSKSASFSRFEAKSEDIGPCTLLVESFLDGSEHAVEAVIEGDTLQLGAIADRLSIDSETFDADLYKMPTALSANQIELVHEAIRLGAMSQGIGLGVLHAEVRFHHGRPYILEIAARPGGGSIQYTSEASYGYCPVSAALTVAEGRSVDVPPLKPTGEVSIALTMLCDEGHVEKLSVPPGVRNMPGVINFQVVPKPGGTVYRPPLGNDVLGFLGTKGNSLDDALTLADRIFTSIEIDLTPLAHT